MALSAADKLFRSKHPRPLVQAMKPRIAHAPDYKAPNVTSLTPSTVVHTAAVNTVVGTLATTQKAPPGYSSKPLDDTFTYAITGGTGAALYKIVGNQVQVNGVLTAGTTQINVRTTGVNSGLTSDFIIPITAT